MLKLNVVLPRKAKGEKISPMVMVGKCVFAAKGYVSLVRVSNPLAEKKFAQILLTQSISGNRGTAETLSISASKANEKKIIFIQTDPKKNSNSGIVESAFDLAGLKFCPEKILYCQDANTWNWTHRKQLRQTLKENKKIQLLIISMGNDSKNRPFDIAAAERYLSFLSSQAMNKRMAVVLIFDQYNGAKKPTNGNFKGTVEKLFFSISKLTCLHPGNFRFESVRAPREHDFFPITICEENREILYERGVEINRIPK